ncbi:MAG: phosphotransferase [Actinomycetes bacterium]
MTSERLQVLRRGSPRIALGAAPARVRAWVERVLGSPIVAATTQTGGFSPGVAARVRCADGSRAFVKAVGVELNPDSPKLIRREIEVLTHLPESLPRPTMLGSYDVDGWVGLLLEDVDGTLPDLPWRADQLWRVLDALSELAVVTPEPRLAAALAGEDLSRLLTTWEDFRVADRDQLDAWSLTHLEALIDQGRRAVAGLAGGQTLCHVDVRSDNLLLTNDRAVLVDWSWAAIGPSWFDPALLLLELRTAGGPDPDEVVATHPLLRAVDPDLITAFVAGATGMLLRNSRRPAPPGLPTLRAFQAAYADALLEWTKERTGWT